MQEIARGIYIEDMFIGVTLGAISLPHGLILIDAPPRMEDARSWRSALLNLGGGVDRLLVNLDAHPDRTLGGRSIECTVVAHEKTSQVFRNRPTTFKAQNSETGAEWELISGLGSIRWAPPEITFSHHMLIHWGEAPVVLEYHPGPNSGAIWAVVRDPKVIFLGDAVTPHQPPFLANADLGQWIETLQLLLTDAYRDFILISSRNGVVNREDVRSYSDMLKRIETQLDKMAERKDPPEATESLISGILASLKTPSERKEQYIQRLRWGLDHYYARHYHQTTVEGEE